MKRMMKISGFLMVFVIICGTLISCGSTKNIMSVTQREVFNKAIMDKDFTIELEVMEPFVTNTIAQISNQIFQNTGNTANRVNIRSQGYTIKIKNDSIIANLPYVGERQMGGGYDNLNIGINIKDTYKEYQISQDEKFTNIVMQAKNATESYNIRIAISDSGYTRVHFFSSQRNTISYTGYLRIDAEEDIPR